MTLRDNIAQRIRQHGEAPDVAQRIAIGNFRLFTSAECDAIDKAIYASLSRFAFGRLWARIRSPNYSDAASTLERLVQEGKDAHAILARQRDAGTGRNTDPAPESVASRNQLVAVVNRCEALRAYAHSMATGEHAAYRQKYLHVYIAMRRQETRFILEDAGLL